jgi:hypothetical protein
MNRSPEGSSNIPPAPDVTAGFVLKDKVLPSAKRAVMDASGTVLWQSVLTEASGSDWREILPKGDTALLQSLFLLAGAGLSELVSSAFIAAKENVGLEPESYLGKKAWRWSIRLQGPSMVLSTVNTAAEFFENPAAFDIPTENAAGLYVTLAAGGLSVIDNLVPRPEKGELIDMALPTAELLVGIGGFLMTPDELKPIVAGGVIATLSNFSENLIETGSLALKKYRSSANKRSVPSASQPDRSAMSTKEPLRRQIAKKLKGE